MAAQPPTRDAKRDERARLEAELAAKKSPLCQSVGRWEVTSSPKPGAGEAKVRCVKCTACGRTDKIDV